MGELTNALIEVYSRAAAGQGGVISGDNPAAYDAADPFRLWTIQLVVIIAMIQLLSTVFSRMRQPRVISEVIGGIILGPTVMGRIPGFTNAIFPAASIPMLTLTSTIGLVLFLFLVGLEIDTRILKRNMMSSASVSVAGLVLPLGLGAALGVGIYREFVSPSVNFGYFLLFVAVAIGITAFPVLCRILTELKLLDTEVGLVTLSAGIGNDVVGWILLALVVALLNADSGLTALWVLLACAGYCIFLLFPVKWAYRWLAIRTGSLEQGAPTLALMTITLMLVFANAFFTDIIGVHPIFGGFITGLIIPHDNGFAISIVEKIEDLVCIILLPIYFILSGLKTNLGLLNSGKDWGYIVIICLVAFVSKFGACAGTALASGFPWREAGAIGALMSCKGLVELIVLNIGLSAGVLDVRTFSMFVVHALVLTFITTPLTLFFYPPKYRTHHREKATSGDESHATSKHFGDSDIKSTFAIILDKIEQLPAAMTLSQLLYTPMLPPISPRKVVDEKLLQALDDEKSEPPVPGITMEALRLIELTYRTSAVLRSQEADSLIYNDPVVSVYKTFGHLNNIKVSANLSVINHDEFPDAVAKHVKETQSQMVIVPWSRGTTSALDDESPDKHNGVRNPFDGIFHKTTSEDQTSSYVYSEYIRNIFSRSPTDVALFVDRGAAAASISGTHQHIFMPFFGGPDDRAALTFLVQLCENPRVTATVVKIVKTDAEGGEKTKQDVPGFGAQLPTFHNTVAAADTIYGQHNTETRLASNTADSITWDRYSNPSSRSTAPTRMSFQSQSSPHPLHKIIELVRASATQSLSTSGKTLIVLTGRSRRLAVESLHGELRDVIAETGSSISSSVPKTLGDVGAALVAANMNASLLVIQAAPS